MFGEIKRIKGDNGNYIYPVSTSNAIYVDKDKNLKEKLKEIDSTMIAYVIEIDKFGIKKGDKVKPYSIDDYNQSASNVIGINNALLYAQEKGYNLVVLPKGLYTICYPHQIQMVDNMTLNLNGSTLRVIYDSDNRSPFDTSTELTWKFSGYSISFARTINAHLINGTLKGDMFERTFTDPEEKWVEHTYGVTFTAGCSYCSVSYCNISGYAGDNINFTSYGKTFNQYPESIYELGDLDNTGVVIPHTSKIVSNFIMIPEGIDRFVIGGSGYSRRTALINKEFTVAFYDKDDKFLGKTNNYRVQSPVIKPLKASKIRFVFSDETNPTKAKDYFVHWGGIPFHCSVSFCEISHGHRGGITGGGSYCTIENNFFYLNGKIGGESYFDDTPQFPDSTKYHINQEDSYGDNTIIKDNVFQGGFHGILIRGYSATVSGNVFHQNGGSAVVIYDQQFIDVTGNYFRTCGTGVTMHDAGGMNEAVAHIHNNYFWRSGGSFSGGRYKEVLVSNNYFFNAIHPSITDSVIFRNNRITLDSAIYPSINISLNEKCVDNFYDIIGTNKLIIYYQSTILGRNSFNNVDIRPNLEDTFHLFEDCIFKNSIIRGQKNRASLTVRNCKLIDTTIMQLLLNGTENTTNNTWRFEDCKIEIITKDRLFEEQSNKINSTSFYFLNNEVIIKNKDMNKLHVPVYKTPSTTKYFLNNKIIYTGNETKLLSIIDNGKYYKLYIGDNKFENVALDSKVTPEHIYYNPFTFSDQAPTKGYYQTGDIMKNSSPNTGVSIGWVCVSTGVANNTAWLATTAYTIGQQVNIGNNVYECTIAGTSGDTAPNHVTGTAVDGTVTWQYLGKLAVFKPYGQIL